jgi:hypothetical protein
MNTHIDSVFVFNNTEMRLSCARRIAKLLLRKAIITYNAKVGVIRSV